MYSISLAAYVLNEDWHSNMSTLQLQFFWKGGGLNEAWQYISSHITITLTIEVAVYHRVCKTYLFETAYLPG